MSVSDAVNYGSVQAPVAIHKRLPMPTCTCIHTHTYTREYRHVHRHSALQQHQYAYRRVLRSYRHTEAVWHLSRLKRLQGLLIDTPKHAVAHTLNDREIRHTTLQMRRQDGKSDARVVPVHNEVKNETAHISAFCGACRVVCECRQRAQDCRTFGRAGQHVCVAEARAVAA